MIKNWNKGGNLQKVLDEIIDYIKSAEGHSLSRFQRSILSNLCDVCDIYLGAEMYQKQDGVNRVIRFAYNFTFHKSTITYIIVELWNVNY